MVDVRRKKTCTCRFWDLVDIPCRHAYAALSYRQQKQEDFVDDCYTRKMYALCYSFSISPINGVDMWSKVDRDDIHLLCTRKDQAEQRN